MEMKTQAWQRGLRLAALLLLFSGINAVVFQIVDRTSWFGGPEIAKLNAWSRRIQIATELFPRVADQVLTAEADTVEKKLKDDVLSDRSIGRDLFLKLIDMPVEDLYVLKASNDPCAGELDCKGKEWLRVRPLVEAALDHKRELRNAEFARLSAEIASKAARTSQYSLAISIGSFLVSIAGLFM